MNEKVLKATTLKKLLLKIKYNEATTNGNHTSEDDQKFPFDLFDVLMKKIFNSKSSELTVIGKYLSFYDLRYFTLKFLNDTFDSTQLKEKTIENILDLLCLMPDMNRKNKGEVKLYAIKKCETESSTLLKIDVHRKLYNDCVFNLLKCPLTDDLFKKVLKKLPNKILPKMSNPLILSDFLTQSYNMGGIISVLALNSLFTLMTEYNLEYPKFYEKVYEQLDNSVFHTNYKERYYYLLDTFLSSSHLSVNLVASFIKKISRLVLTCPSGDTVVLLRLLRNLFTRHPNCLVLLHSRTNKSLADDPFDVNAIDFEKTNAIQSSIWEIQALKNHYLYEIVAEVAKFNDITANKQADELESKSYEEMVDASTESKFSAPFNFEYSQSANLNFLKPIKF